MKAAHNTTVVAWLDREECNKLISDMLTIMKDLRADDPDSNNVRRLQLNLTIDPYPSVSAYYAIISKDQIK
jgi:hypothetical protein